jgi:hypothetical protein
MLFISWSRAVASLGQLSSTACKTVVVTCWPRGAFSLCTVRKRKAPNFEAFLFYCSAEAKLMCHSSLRLLTEYEYITFRPQLHPVVVPHVSHFKHVPFRTMVKLLHSVHWSPV